MFCVMLVVDLDPDFGKLSVWRKAR